MDYEIAITVDSNDGDYNTETSTISEEDLEAIKPLIEAMKNFKPYIAKAKGLKWEHRHNYPFGEDLPREDLGEKFPNEIYPDIDEDAFEIFQDHAPFGEGGFHTVESIRIYPVPVKIRLL